MLKCPLLFHDQQLVNACTPTKTSQMLCHTALVTLPVSRNHVRLCVPLYRTWNVIAEAKTGNEYIYIIAVTTAALQAALLRERHEIKKLFKTSL